MFYHRSTAVKVRLIQEAVWKLGDRLIDDDLWMVLRLLPPLKQKMALKHVVMIDSSQIKQDKIRCDKI